jgi:hypothetical protein
MHFRLSAGRVEEHEPVHSHLRVEMSPLPTRLNRQVERTARRDRSDGGPAVRDM